jgi:outer membrane lipoprotein-sorting protein
MIDVSTPLPAGNALHVASWRRLVASLAACATVLSLGMHPAPVRAQTMPAAWAAFEKTWEDVLSYSATVAIFERQGTQVQSSVVDYTFSKPASALVHFVAGKNTGVTVAWDGGGTVVAHLGGLIGVFKKTFPLHDPQVTSIRGSSIDQLSFAAFIAHSEVTPGVASESAGPSILDIPTVTVTLVPTSAATDTGLTRETIDLSLATSLPIRALAYEGDTLVREVDFSNVKLQIQPQKTRKAS